jgi:opacity protein-like surface antigen
MKKIILATALATMMSGSAAFAQANPNAPQPGSTGVGVNQPGTTGTGTAVDRPDSTKASGSMKKDATKDGMAKGHTTK